RARKQGVAMQRALPPRANLDHLKAQAKDLLDAHGHADPAALARIRDAVPAFARMTDAAIAAAPFALHDAQSAIAREYGHRSWNDLREAVAAQTAQASGVSDELLRALMPMPFPAEVGAALREASTRRREAVAAAEAPLAEALPLIALRDALFLPRALGPIQVGRPTSRAAVDAALGRTPPTLALFSQRDAAREEVDADALHPVGCEVFVHACIADGERAWIVLEGVRRIHLDSLAMHPGGCQVARVAPFVLEEVDASDVIALAATLRARARDLAAAFPDAARLLALIDAAEPDRLADLVVANHPASVTDKATYAAEPRLAERLRIANALAAKRA
ncbi:MAG TPA: LON peptidase substrate-binding domain-containing protein, partial [Polyangiaceae bacterium]|nr:LON peptidase substrate-binding domain-containing protein [Polyangiaceae bacterium]